MYTYSRREGILLKITEVRPHEGFHLWVRFNDEANGYVALDDLVGRGVFEIWSDRRIFESVRINEVGSLEWPGEVDLCADALYLRLTGKLPEELFPSLRSVQSDA